MKPSLRLKRRGRFEPMQDAAPVSGKAGLKLRGQAEKGAGQVRGQAHKMAGQLEPYADSARKVMTERATDAWDWAEPRIEYAAETVQKDIAPRVSSALNTAAERSAPAREEASKRGTAAFAALKGEPPAVKQKRRWPLAMLFFLVGGAVGAAAGIFGQRMAPAPVMVDDLGQERDQGTSGVNPDGGAAGEHTSSRTT